MILVPITSDARRRRRCCWFWCCWPIVLGTIAVAILGFASTARGREVTRRSPDCGPRRNPSTRTEARWFQAGTRRKNAPGGHSCRRRARFVGRGGQSFPFIGTGKLPELSFPAETGRTSANRRVPAGGPAAHHANRAGRPVSPRFGNPLLSNGVSTLLPELQGSRSVIRLLQLEVQHASIIAMRAGLARTCRNADHGRSFEWDFCMVAIWSELPAEHSPRCDPPVAGGNRLGAGPVGSVACAGTAPRDVPARWHRIVAGERAMTLAWLQGNREDWRGCCPEEARAIRRHCC